jgi:Lipopolysaccharide-assembly
MKKILLIAIALMNLYGTCRYSMRDVSIPPEVKTVKVNYITNEARYVNPQLSPKLTDKLRQKIVNQTRLSQTNSEAHYEISGRITDYSVSTSGISNQESSSNNLNVTVHISFVNRLDNTKNFASLSLTQAETQLANEIINNLSDEIFNRIFSNW